MPSTTYLPVKPELKHSQIRKGLRIPKYFPPLSIPQHIRHVTRLARTARMFTDRPERFCYSDDHSAKATGSDSISTYLISADWKEYIFPATRDSWSRRFCEGDWPRVHPYARRIHSLKGVHFTRTQRRCDIHPNVIAELSAYRPVRMLSPELHILVFSQSWLADLAVTPFGQILLRPSLTETPIVASDIPEGGGQSYSSLELLSGSLQRLCPNIQSLSFHDPEKALVMSTVYQLVRSPNHPHYPLPVTPSDELVSHPVCEGLVAVTRMSAHSHSKAAPFLFSSVDLLHPTNFVSLLEAQPLCQLGSPTLVNARNSILSR